MPERLIASSDIPFVKKTESLCNIITFNINQKNKKIEGLNALIIYYIL